jgi:phosphoribosyl-AMP cyclohydrolase
MDFSKLDGLIPAVVQDHVSGEVLMVGFMNQEAWDITEADRLRDVLQPHAQHAVDEGRDLRQQLAVRDVLIDCDEDTVLVKAERLGGGNVCHTGERTCFFQRAEGVTGP